MLDACLADDTAGPFRDAPDLQQNLVGQQRPAVVAEYRGDALPGVLFSHFVSV